MSNGNQGHILARLAKLQESIQRKTTPLEDIKVDTANPTDARAEQPAARDDGLEHDSDGEGIADRFSPAIERMSGDSPLVAEQSEIGGPARTNPRPDLNALLRRIQEVKPEIVRANRAAAVSTSNATDGSLLSKQIPTANPPVPPAETRRAIPTVSSVAPQNLGPPPEPFFPKEPASFEDAGLNSGLVEELLLKYLLAVGESTGTNAASQLRLPFPAIGEILTRMKYDQLIQYRGTTTLNDYVCSLTDVGRERARRHSMRCTYFGAAPVPLEQYKEAVELQSLRHQSPARDDLVRAFDDLLINPEMLHRLGAAMNSGRGMFLYGFPGNGKTSIAERVTKAFGEYIWIPRAVGIDGEIIRIFDPSQHVEAAEEQGGDIIREVKSDARWVRIRRPTIIVGGELTMANLELAHSEATGINEAPVQLKSNCGTLVIDDFGRQRISVAELLNRWIVPLEKRVDYLNLPSGKKAEVPFDQLVIFSTNLEPKSLVDDAFLRRIPYKINVDNPNETEFRTLFQMMCPKMGFEYEDRAIDYLIAKHYQPTERPFRCCHPRDLLLQIQNYCKYTRRPLNLEAENFDFAAQNYFCMM